MIIIVVLLFVLVAIGVYYAMHTQNEMNKMSKKVEVLQEAQEEALSNLAKDINDNDQSLSSYATNLNTQVQKTESRLHENETSLSGLKSSVNILQSDTTNLRSLYKDVKQKNDELGIMYSKQKLVDNSLKTKMNLAENKLTKVDSRVDFIANSMNDLDIRSETRYKEFVDTYKADFEKLRAEFNASLMDQVGILKKELAPK
jgi:chromosome segregation ATPase